MLKWWWFLLLSWVLVPLANAVNVPLDLFPLQHYNQSVDHWVPPNDKMYHKRLLTARYQQQRQHDFLRHWLSPWNPQYVQLQLMQQNPNINEVEISLLKSFDNRNETANAINYQENFRPTTIAWVNAIANNIAGQFTDVKYHASHRAIMLTNSLARELPSSDPSFYHFTYAGQGYPFDNLQMASIWAGTPAYIVATTKDRAWDLMLTPAVLAWVPANHVAPVSNLTVSLYTELSDKNLGAIIHTKTSVFDNVNNFDFSAYVGSVYPELDAGRTTTQILIPKKGLSDRAVLVIAHVANHHIAKMPFAATPQHFAILYKTLQGRPYGWGGMNFYNDCSQEMKNLYAPFGIWLPRNSSYQAKYAGQAINLTDIKKVSARLSGLVAYGRPMLSLVYFGDHVVQYVGDLYPNPNKPHTKAPLTYQNMWGLHERNNIANNHHRDVVGESVFFPLLKSYPEKLNDNTQANRRDFVIVNLDQMPSTHVGLVRSLLELML